MDIVSLNVRGLGEATKRQTLFHWLETHRFHIICLQETFCTEANGAILASDWKGPSYHCFSSSSHSKGVTILIHPDFSHKVINHYISNDGRRQLLNLEHNDQTFTIVNLYAPTDVSYRRNFLLETRKWIIDKALNQNCLIVCGDFNCTISDIDRKVKNIDRYGLCEYIRCNR